MTQTLTRTERTARRNQRLRDAFYSRYTNQPRVNGFKLYSREGVLAQLADEYNLSMTTVERIVLPKAI